MVAPDRKDAYFERLPSFSSRPHHVRSLVRADAAGDYDALRRTMSRLVNAPLGVPADQPQWEVMVEELPPQPGGAGPETLVVFRVHHALADGVALGGLMMSLADEGEAMFGDMVATALKKKGPRAPAKDRRGQRRRPPTAASRTWRALLRVARLAVWLVAQVLGGPLVLGKYAALLCSNRRGVFGSPGLEKSVAWSEGATFRVQDVKEASRRFGCTINDLAIHCICQAMRGVVSSREWPAGGVPKDLQVIVPVNLRPLFALVGGKLGEGKLVMKELVQSLQGNTIGVLAVSLPLDASSRTAAIQIVRERLGFAKFMPEALVGYLTASFGGLLPLSAQQSFARRTLGEADVAVSNVVGPPRTIHIAGMEVTQVVGFLPPPPGVSLGIVVSSYRGDFQLTVNADMLSAGDARPLLESIEAEMGDVVYGRRQALAA